MAFTRFYYDPNRIHRQVQQSSFDGLYQFNTPGQGMDLPFSSEPHMRLQGWGANFDNNMITQENDLRGLTLKLNKDLVDENNYKKYEILPVQPFYRSEDPYVEESRASHPAWTYKDLEQTRWEEPFINPQAAVERPFDHNVQTRILEKDGHVARFPDLSIISDENN